MALKEQHKVAVVTGGASGIGAAIVEALLARGDCVVILDVQQPAKGDDANGSTTWLETDVGDENLVERAFGMLEERFGRVDILVNSAGIGIPAPLLETSLDLWAATNRVNATGVFLCARAAARSMAKRRSGSIVSISSTNAYLGVENTSAYAASKGAVEAFTRATAAELGPLGIRVNAVAPGAIDTPLWGGRLVGEVRKRMSELSALGVVGAPSDVAAAVAYLTSDAARFVTGVVLPVCGGRSTTEHLSLA